MSRRTLGVVCDPPQYGWTTRAVSSGAVKLLRTTDISSGRVDWSNVPYCSEVPDDLAKFQLHDGDVVISRAGSVGASCLVRHPPTAVFASYLIRFRPREEIDPAYVAHFLKSREYWDQVRGMAAGIAMPNVNAQKLRMIELPVPELPRQRAIVRRLDAATTCLSSAGGSLKRASQLVRTLRAVVIDLACTGRLLHAGSASSTPNHLPPGWRWTTLDALLAMPLRNGHSAKASAHGPVRTLTLTAVTLGDFGPSNTKLTGADPQRVRDLWLQPGDILFERSNTAELVGTARVYRGPANYAIFPDLMIRARVRPEVDLRYLELVLEWRRTREYFRSRAVGIAGNMPKVDQATVAGMPIPLPPLSEQEAISAYSAERLSQVENLRTTVAAVGRRIAPLRDTLLRGAFAFGPEYPQ